ncbi:hypothetical protein Pmar_PMAR013534 [Perkinsus marinus ATCC 50983]|uniref:Uncharacterized protein n=1 Tax=Perkinsus marinus (strain ATCC 50983 / TXsc) TaxID=423536 RepID=C5LJ29_PERM5|nr:hypothetical protein Pmar_PMAR013534 [Perkinsus marinus ATCC 50983]EER03262.1 hypothetical protein Pmar_PMAR013534 [Perkinsus marinus ATCC 50983]|eukprot:XP_002771446.1 hypothetical protein Pmar_PMAR013534 [Perkinsus marinus ATCC 50983]
MLTKVASTGLQRAVPRAFCTAVEQLHAAGVVKEPKKEREFARLRDGEETFDAEETRRSSLWWQAIGRNATVTRQEMYMEYKHSLKSLRSLLDYYDIAVPAEHEIDLEKSAASVGLALPKTLG